MKLWIFLATVAVLNAETIVLRHANVIDAVANEPIRGATMVLRYGKIDSIVGGDQAGPGGATVLDCEPLEMIGARGK